MAEKIDIESATLDLKVGHIRQLEKRLDCRFSDLAGDDDEAEAEANADQLVFAAFIAQVAMDPDADFETLWGKAENMTLGDIEAAMSEVEVSPQDPPVPAASGTNS